MTISILTAFILYFAVLAAIAFIVHKRTKRASDFMLGGRSMNYFVTAIAAQASDMSSWLFLAFPAAIFSNGLFEFWTAIGLITFMYLNWTYIAPRLRVATQEYNALTLSSFLSRRFHDAKGLISLTCAVFSIFFFTIYIASALLGISRLFKGAFELDLVSSILIGAFIALVYTNIGGFLAVAWCNVFKGLFMLAVIVAVPLLAMNYVGPISNILGKLHKAGSLTLFPADKSILTSLLLVCGWGLGYFGQPHILIYFMSIDDVKKITYSKYIGIAWMAIALTAAAATGLIGIVHFGHNLPIPETLFIELAKALFNPFFAGVALCGIFAATLATMNNHILISGSVFAEDFYKRFFNRTLSSEGQVTAARIGSFLICLCAVAFILIGKPDSIYSLVAYAWSGLGSAFGPILLVSLYSKRVTYAAALLGILTGGIVAALWPLLNTNIMPMVAGFFSSFIVIILISLVTYPLKKERIHE